MSAQVSAFATDPASGNAYQSTKSMANHGNTNSRMPKMTSRNLMRNSRPALDRLVSPVSARWAALPAPSGYGAEPEVGKFVVRHKDPGPRAPGEQAGAG